MAPSPEHVVLEFEVQRLRDELRQYDQELPCWTAEVKAAESYAESLESEYKQEELSEQRLAVEMSQKRKIRALSPASSQGDRDHHEAVDHHAEAGVAVHVFEDPLVPVHGMTDEEIAKHHQERQMSHELARRAVSIAHLRRRKTSLADEAIARARREAEQLREQLMEAEAEGRRLTEERQAAEEQELPLREWVKHIEDQVTTARLENARLSSSLSSALAFRASLLPDEGHTPAGAETGAHIQQVCWLREHQRQCTSRKEKLKEEIAAEERRRDSFLRDAGRSADTRRSGGPRRSPAASPERSYLTSSLRSLPPTPFEKFHSLGAAPKDQGHQGLGEESEDEA